MHPVPEDRSRGFPQTMRRAISPAFPTSIAKPVRELPLWMVGHAPWQGMSGHL